MIAVEGLSTRQGTFALDGVSFHIPTGEYAVLMGPTGSGKTSLLETIAGLRHPAAGRVLLGNHDMTHLPPAVRNVGYVPQDAVLFKTMSVWENIAFALTVRKMPQAEIESRVRELAELLGLTSILSRQAVGLSGGEAQRVALGRALAFRPQVLLLDEPFNAVDEATRDRLVELLRGVREERTMTMLHVTHSSSEAEQLGERILRFDRGRVVEATKSDR